MMLSPEPAPPLVKLAPPFVPPPPPPPPGPWAVVPPRKPEEARVALLPAAPLPVSSPAPALELSSGRREALELHRHHALGVLPTQVHLRRLIPRRVEEDLVAVLWHAEAHRALVGEVEAHRTRRVGAIVVAQHD